MSVPKQTKVLVIGGGPGGLIASITLARQKIETVCLEKYVKLR